MSMKTINVVENAVGTHQYSKDKSDCLQMSSKANSFCLHESLIVCLAVVSERVAVFTGSVDVPTVNAAA